METEVLKDITAKPKIFETATDIKNTLDKTFFFSTSTNLNNHARFSLKKLKENKKKLLSFKTLLENWNGNNGEIFDETLIDEVIKIISNLEYQPNIFPTGRGTVQLEKHIDEDNFIEIEISKDEVFAFQVKNGKQFEGIISKDQISDYVTAIYG